MERAARLINNKNVSRELVSDEDIARAIWATAVGATIAEHTSRLKLVRHNLVVEVEDAIWQRQLHSLSGQIVQRIQKLMGTDAVREIEFRIGIARREPQRAGTRKSELFTDPVNETQPVQDALCAASMRSRRRKPVA
jgi:predicted nucleic acid-binding Zn ribbon protein